MAVSIRPFHPHHAPLPLRADRVFGVPVDHKLSCREAVRCLPLPTLVVRHGANQGHPVLGTTRQEMVGGDIARSHQLFPWRQLAGGQASLHNGPHGKIGGRGRCGRDIGDAVGRLVVTGFGDMHLVACLFRLALFAITGFRVIGGADQQRRWWQIISAAPAHGLALGGGVALLEPHLPQGLDGRHLPQPGGRGRIVEGPQPLAAVWTDLRGQSIASGLLHRQAIFRKPPAVAIEPHRRHPGLEPDWRGGGQHVERLAQRFGDALQPIERLDGSQDMCRVGALVASSFEEPLLAKPRQHRLAEEEFGMACDQALTALA
jgi:hypothetical protein